MWFIWGGAGEVGVERGMQLSQGRGGQVQAYWVFKIKKYNWRREGKERQITKKIYIFFFIAIPPIERTFCWGGMSAKDF